MKFIVTILLFNGFFSIAYTQNIFSDRDTANYPFWIQMMRDPTVNFFKVQQAANLYWEKRGNQGAGYKAYKRWEHYWKSRVLPNGDRLPPDYVWNQYFEYIESHENLRSGAQISPCGDWTEIGPSTIPTSGGFGLGRLNCIAFHPTNESIIYVGAASGGLWKTTNAGATWSSNTDNLPSLGVSSILIDFNNPSIMYMGTGDRDHGDAPGLGVMKSIDGGASWSISSNGMGNITIGSMIMHPGNSSIIIAVGDNGIYKTINGGLNWSNTYSEYGIEFIEFKPGDPNIVYATGWSNFYRSTDNGNTWNAVTSGLPNPINTGRMAIGVSPANPNYVYCLATDDNVGLFTGLYKSTDSGASFSVQSTSPNIMGRQSSGADAESQAWYDLCLAVDPVNADIIYSGGIRIFKSMNGGVTWTVADASMHVDHHALEFSPLNGKLYCGNDGGIDWTNNGGTSWNNISNGLAIAQVYKIGQSATQKDLVINGYQDNGTSIYNSGLWANMMGGDGMECIFDYSDKNFVYGEIQNGERIRRSSDGGTSVQIIAGDGINGINEKGGWVTPYILHETDPNTMFIGFINVWRSNNIKNHYCPTKKS